MKRVMIIGQPGAGKSTLAQRLGEKTALPVFHMDQIHWMPGWTERPKPEKWPLVEAVMAQDEWVFEGGHSQSWDARLARADTLIWIDIPVWIRFWRVVKRRIQYRGKTRADLPENCPERLDPEFIRWIWDTRTTARDKMLNLYKNAPVEKTKHRFRSLKEVNSFLSGI